MPFRPDASAQVAVPRLILGLVLLKADVSWDPRFPDIYGWELVVPLLVFQTAQIVDAPAARRAARISNFIPSLVRKFRQRLLSSFFSSFSLLETPKLNSCEVPKSFDPTSQVASGFIVRSSEAAAWEERPAR